MRSGLKVSLAVVGATLAQGACFAGAAHAAAETETFTVNGAPSEVGGFPQVLSSSFAEFNPALGTLNSITINASGTATLTVNGSGEDAGADFLSVTSLAEPNIQLVGGQGSAGGAGTFDISATGTESGELAPFEGASATAVYFQFAIGVGDTLSVNDVPGSVTYNYTPAVASVPEPVGWSVFAAGLATPIALRLRRRTTG
jgi:hypothetical protein